MLALLVLAALWAILLVVRFFLHRRMPEAKGLSHLSWAHGALAGALATLLVLTITHASQAIYKDSVSPRLVQFGLIHGPQADNGKADREARPADASHSGSHR